MPWFYWRVKKSRPSLTWADLLDSPTAPAWSTQRTRHTDCNYLFAGRLGVFKLWYRYTAQLLPFPWVQCHLFTFLWSMLNDFFKNEWLFHHHQNLKESLKNCLIYLVSGSIFEYYSEIKAYSEAFIQQENNTAQITLFSKKTKDTHVKGWSYCQYLIFLIMDTWRPYRLVQLPDFLICSMINLSTFAVFLLLKHVHP